MLAVDIRPMGDTAVLAVLGDRIDAAIVRRVWTLASSLKTCEAFDDVVPAYASVLVRFDPRALDLAHAMAIVRGAAERTQAASDRRRRRVMLRVSFGGVDGVDFETAAHELGMREVRFRDAFCKPEYRVAFLGFVAGFPYLLGLPSALTLPRHPAARPRVPAGSVAIAAAQCGIYPRQSPGGWRLLGRTLAPLFNPADPQPTLLVPGDAVRFEPAPRIEDTRHVELSG